MTAPPPPRTVSIVIPTFNRAGMVTKAIDTALAQTHPCQVIVCDHGSTDDTPATVAAYGDRVTYIRRETDFGPHFCWLEGVLNATGDFVHMQYDDDWIAPDFIEKTMALMRDDVGAVVTDATIVNLDSGARMRFRPLGKAHVTSGTFPNRILERPCLKGRVISPAACLYRKHDVIDALYQGRLPTAQGGEYHGVGPDMFMLLLTFLRYPRFGYVAEELAFYGSHDGSITVDAQADPATRKAIRRAYRDMRHYYQLLRTHKRLRPLFTVLHHLGI
jgi:glycosyltransferase involved in cell wall biosynthesis